MGWLNADMEKVAVEQLNLTGTEKVLELGFGSGIGLKYLASKIPSENVAGVEPSSAMRTQAAARLSSIGRSAVQIREGSSANIPWPPESFDAVVSVNNVQ